MSDFETLLYDERDHVAWVTLNRPEVHNAFNATMRDELQRVWRDLRENDDVRCAVLTAAGDRAFCTGIDRKETMGDWVAEDGAGPEVGTGKSSRWHFTDPGELVGPKSNDLWKPVIAAVNGIACGGAFYMLGEVDFIVAADHATFFDPHVTFGMTAGFEPIHMLQKMPFHEIMRLTLLGNHERMSARRAHEIGLVSEVVPLAELAGAAEWAATRVASAPAIATQGTVRALWMGRELSRAQALDLAKVVVTLGSDPETLQEGEAAFRTGDKITPRIR